jgi:ferrous iron transport protein B
VRAGNALPRGELSPPLIALVGNPNCGKTALFNLLTGSRQKIANYAGVTVERKSGVLATGQGARLEILDLPGVYSLTPRTPDEQITHDVLVGSRPGEAKPDILVAVLDATNLRQNLRLVMALLRLGKPLVVALNMADLARGRELPVDAAGLSRELRVPVVETRGTRAGGAKGLASLLALKAGALREQVPAPRSTRPENDAAEVERILAALKLDALPERTMSDAIDRVVLNPVLGPIILAVILFFMFQAVFAGAKPFMSVIQAGVSLLAAKVSALLPAGPLASLLVDGVIAGAGTVIVFLPQILILFFFILLLEDSGYLPRAAFLLDRIMGVVGLSGRAFIPLLSSFACAIPGIMATRTIPHPRDRLITIMIAPLMTCSARLPVYALLIGAFVPARTVLGGFELQGLVLFALYFAGVASAFLVAACLKLFGLRGALHPLQMELPPYHWPSERNLLIGLWSRTQVFLSRVGTIILALTVLLWFLSSFPAPPPGATAPAITYSIAGRIGHALAILFAPIGFNWQISLALVPGLAAREVAVGALGTVYALGSSGPDVAGALTPVIAASWTLPTALALLAWYVYAPQCLSTLAVTRRETNSWRYPVIMAAYQFALAYLAAGITFHAALAAWGG